MEQQVLPQHDQLKAQPLDSSSSDLDGSFEPVDQPEVQFKRNSSSFVANSYSEEDDEEIEPAEGSDF